MKTKTAVLAAALPLLLAACSSTHTTKAVTPVTHPVSATETLSATVTGKAAAANLNANSNAPLTFGSATLRGPVNATIKPFALTGGNAKTGRTVWLTTSGPLAVTHTTTQQGNPVFTKDGKTCRFTALFAAGTFSQLGGNLTATSWSGNFKVTATGEAPLNAGSTKCTQNDTGAIQASGASITFLASGAMTKS